MCNTTLCVAVREGNTTLCVAVREGNTTVCVAVQGIRAAEQGDRVGAGEEQPERAHLNAAGGQVILQGHRYAKRVSCL